MRLITTAGWENQQRTVTNYQECLGNVVKALGYHVFSSGPNEGAALQQLKPVLSAPEQYLKTQSETADWGQVSSILEVIAQRMALVAMKIDASTLHLIMAKPATTGNTTIEYEHAFVEACGNWMKAVREHTGRFKLSPEAQGLVKQGVTAVAGSHPLVSLGLTIALGMHDFGGSVRAAVVTAYGSAPDSYIQQWLDADLTVRSGGAYSTMWIWDLSRNAWAQSVGGSSDTPLEPFDDGLDGAPDMANQIKAMCT